MQFPKIIHICDKTLEHIKITSNIWKKLNPDYEIMLYDDKMCKSFLEEEFSETHKLLFEKIPDGPTNLKTDQNNVHFLEKNGCNVRRPDH